MPIHRRLPKRGFTNIFRKEFAIVNTGDLVCFESEQVVDEAALIRVGKIRGKRDGVKLLGNGEISIPLTIKLDRVSKGAREKIEAAGGSIVEPGTAKSDAVESDVAKPDTAKPDTANQE